METVVVVLMILVCFNFMLKQTYRKWGSVTLIAVVCALFVTIESRSPTRAFISVDFPTFGFPKMLTKPDL